jgi:hypothetical protein
MPRFFNRIRKQLAKENKFFQYSRYAIGEILLVVIGILIALQVNDWAEARKKKRFLNYSLSQIHQDLESDLELIYRGIEPRLQRKEQGVKDLYDLMLEGSNSDDDTFHAAYRSMSQWFYLTSADGSYQSLQQKGLDIIPNRLLRAELFDFYEKTIPRNREFIHGQDQFIKELHVSEEGNPHHDFVPVSEDYFNHQSLHRIVKINNDDARSKRYRLNGLKRAYFEILEILEEEMADRNIPFIQFDSTIVQKDF